jgi:hypothetical protein
MLLFIFFRGGGIQEGTTMCEALDCSPDMIQPGILLIGQENFIKIEDLFTKLHNSNLVVSICFIISYSYILEVKYPLPLKYVFVFLGVSL